MNFITYMYKKHIRKIESVIFSNVFTPASFSTYRPPYVKLHKLHFLSKLKDKASKTYSKNGTMSVLALNFMICVPKPYMENIVITLLIRYPIIRAPRGAVVMVLA